MKKLIKATQKQINWSSLTTLADWVLEEGIRIQQIPAPTFYEDERAAYVAQQFEAYGLIEIDRDEAKNVYGLLPGSNRAVPAIVVMAHTDTVFSAETDLTIRRDGDLIYGPGLGDNSMGVSGMLGLMKWLHDEQVTPACDIWFVATSCEEGLGDLKGIRAAYQRLKADIGAVINLEGLAFGHIYHAGIAVHRMKITATAGGGHSWLHFGHQSAIHGIMQVGERITRITPPTAPRTTYNIGIIEGGQTINSIAAQASMWLDLRSEEQKELQKIRTQVHEIIQSLEKDDLHFAIEVVGDRPAGAIKVRHPLVQGAMAALDFVQVRGVLETGSTDGNIPLHHGCPTVTIGITRGGNAHRLDEFIETAYIEPGMKQLIVLALSAAQYQRDLNEKAAGD